MNGIRKAAFKVQDKPVSFQVTENEKLTHRVFKMHAAVNLSCYQTAVEYERTAATARQGCTSVRLRLCKTGLLCISSKMYIAAVSKSRYESPAVSYQV